MLLAVLKIQNGVARDPLTVSEIIAVVLQGFGRFLVELPARVFVVSYVPARHEHSVTQARCRAELKCLRRDSDWLERDFQTSPLWCAHSPALGTQRAANQACKQHSAQSGGG